MDLTNAGYTGYPGYATTDYSSLIQTYYTDLSYLADLLAKLTGTYNLLIGSADGFNKIALAKKGDVEDAIDRAEDLGKIIDRVIDALETQTILYINYSKTKGDFIVNNLSFNDIIKSEVHHHIKHEHHDDQEHHDD